MFLMKQCHLPVFLQIYKIKKPHPSQSKRHWCGWVPIGGAKGIRTPDLLNAIQTRYQLRHDPIGCILIVAD